MANPILTAQGLVISAHRIVNEQGIGHKNLILKHIREARKLLNEAPDTNLTSEELLSVGHASVDLLFSAEALIAGLPTTVVLRYLESAETLLGAVIEREAIPEGIIPD